MTEGTITIENYCSASDGAAVDDNAKKLEQELARITEIEESKEIAESEPELARELSSELVSADDNIVHQSIEKEDSND